MFGGVNYRTGKLGDMGTQFLMVEDTIKGILAKSVGDLILSVSTTKIDGALIFTMVKSMWVAMRRAERTRGKDIK
jgi:hypothetical protein